MKFKQWLFNEELYPQSNAAVVYHKTANIKSLQSIIQNGFTKMDRGTYGPGLYTMYEYEDQFVGGFNPTLRDSYGNIIIKIKVSNLNQFVVLIKEEAKRIHGKDWLPSAQIKKLNIKVPDGYAEILDQRISDKEGTYNIRSSDSEYDMARLNREPLPPLYRPVKIHDLLMSKWATQGKGPGNTYRNTTAVKPTEKYPGYTSDFDWDAPLSAKDSNCKGVIFYDPIENGGHNLLIYPPIKDVKLLAFAYVPSIHSVPEKDLNWQDIKAYNANFKGDLNIIAPYRGMPHTLEPNVPQIDPTKTPFQHDKLKGPSYDLDRTDVDKKTGEYKGNLESGKFLHKDQVKASNDLVQILKSIKNKPKETLDKLNKEGFLSNILKNIKILTNFDSTDDILKYLKFFPPKLTAWNNTHDLRQIIYNLEAFENDNTPTQINNLLEALLLSAGKQEIEKNSQFLLHNSNLLKKLNVNTIIKVLNTLQVSDDTLAQFIPFSKDTDQTTEILGKEKMQQLLSNPNVHTHMEKKQREKHQIGQRLRGERLDGLELLELQYQNGKKITDDDVKQAIKTADSQIRLFEFLRNIKYPINGQLFALALKDLYGGYARNFVQSLTKNSIKYINELDPQWVYDNGIIGVDLQKAYIFDALLSPQKKKDFQHLIDYAVDWEKRRNETPEKFKDFQAKYDIQRLPFGYNTLHVSPPDRYHPSLFESGNK